MYLHLRFLSNYMCKLLSALRTTQQILNHRVCFSLQETTIKGEKSSIVMKKTK